MRCLPLVLLLLCCACGGPLEAGPSEPVDSFIAFPSDFARYTRWASTSLQSDQVQGEVHQTGQRTVYVSRRPPRGSREFPVGTMLVKALPGAGRVFARVKRGGGYNAGAPGWEWFELQHKNADEVVFVWRGFGPPEGEGYGGDPNGCNVCHSAFAQNDFVATPGFRLSDF